MAHINLLPWRTELRKEQQRQFVSILVLMLILTGFAILAVHLNYARLQSVQESRNSYLEKQIKIVEKQIKEINELAKKKERLLARMEIIQRLQRNRPEIVRLVDELVRIIPAGVHLTSFNQNGQKLTMNGVAQSNARVSALMRNIENSEWFAKPQLEIIKSGKGDRVFTLRAQQVTKAENN
jgi:type IV pilus assembly protein PilN